MSGRESVVLVLLSAPGVSLVSYQPAPPLPLLPPTVSRPLRTVHEPLSTCVLERRARGRGWACAKNGRGATGKKHSCHVQIWSLDPLVKGWKRTSLYLWLDFCIFTRALSFFLSFFLSPLLTNVTPFLAAGWADNVGVYFNIQCLSSPWCTCLLSYPGHF